MKRIPSTLTNSTNNDFGNFKSAGAVSIPIFVSCTTTGQLCAPAFSVLVQTNSVLKIQYFVPTGHCSSARLNVFVDGTQVLTTGFLGWFGAPPPFNTLLLDTGLIDLGPVSAGSHTLSLKAEGQVSGCNSGSVVSWDGTLNITLS